jgi:hypothetical protein
MKTVPQRTANNVKDSVGSFHNAVIAHARNGYAQTIRIDGNTPSRRNGLHNTI